jgi:nucleoside-diphosphate-sugar epimerase
MRFVVTGANGFVGHALCLEALSRGLDVQPATRSACDLLGVGASLAVGSLHESTDWRAALVNCAAVVHLAARVHVMQEEADDPLTDFRRVNVQGTINLANQAAAAGVKRFVYVSSIKVNGEATQLLFPFRADGEPSPSDAYGISKKEAEEGLRDIAAKTGMEVVIIRPPLVYGPGVKANFASMIRWLESGIPLPLGAIRNRRSLVSLVNLVDLIIICLTHPAAANQTFMVSDGEDVATTELLRRMGKAMGQSARLVPVPEGLLKLMASLLGKSDMAQRLCGSLQVDISKTRELLGWTPPQTLDEGLAQAALWFK